MTKLQASQHKPTRAGFGMGLLEVAATNERVVGLCADLTGSLQMNAFREKYPARFFQTGIAEANMIGIAAGMATAGLIPFAATFANFLTGRVYDQIRQSIAYSNKNVKLCASHAGLTLGEDGATHQILEDLGLMRMLPNMTVICPCDYHQTIAATRAIAKHKGPVYLRFGRPSWPVFTSLDEPFDIGKAQKLIDCQGNKTDVLIFATGHLVWEAIKAEAALAEQGLAVEVVNIHTLKPLDEACIVREAQHTGAVLCVEEHQRHGGLGEAVAAVLVRHQVVVRFGQVAVPDCFGQSGRPEELLDAYALSAPHIVQAATELLQDGSP